MEEIKRVKFPANGRPGNFPEVALFIDDKRAKFIEIKDGDGSTVIIPFDHFRVLLFIARSLLEDADDFVKQRNSAS